MNIPYHSIIVPTIEAEIISLGVFILTEPDLSIKVSNSK